MRLSTRFSVCGFALLAACAHVKPSAPSEPPPQSAAPVVAPAQPAEPVVAPPTAPSPPPAVPESKPETSTEPATQTPPVAPARTTASGARPKPKVAQKTASAAPAAAAPVAAAPPAPAPAKAPLDFNALVQRLRNTSAIGVFTKLSIKNQVDDLLGAFKGYYAGQSPPTLDELHERYDGLVLKVVTLVQNGDAPLASAISASRSAIWERLSNRESFQAI